MVLTVVVQRLLQECVGTLTHPGLQVSHVVTAQGIYIENTFPTVGLAGSICLEDLSSVLYV